MRIGIDFGTCFSSAALMIEGNVTAVKSPDGQGYSLPSSVYVLPSGEILVGRAADRQRARDPSRYKREFKRDLGAREPFVLGGKLLRPEELVAVVLGKLKGEADHLLPEPVTAALLTVPATYSDYKRGLMEQAAQAAGFREVEPLEEPVAAAIAYAHQSGIRQGEVVLIYDLGGGTFDTALLRKQADGYEFLGLPDGIWRCGGTDFDQAIYSDLISRCSSELRDLLSPSRQDVPALLARSVVLEQCIDLKHQLSQVQEAEVPLIVPGVGSVEYYALSRQAFERLIAPYIEETLECCRRVVKSARLQWEQVDRVLLVGGSCRIPYVRQCLGQAFGRPVSSAADPELVVCQGAALVAGQESGAASAEVIVSPRPGEGQYTTIGEAVRQGRAGTLIKVRPGVYRESLVLERPVELVGDGPAGAIIIEATDAPCLVMATERAMVRGMTLRRKGEWQEEEEEDNAFGSTVFVPQGQAVLEDCDLWSESGACLLIVGSKTNPTIRRCKLHDGKAVGLWVYESGQGVLEDCDIFGNAGPGVTIEAGGNPILRRCKLHDNQQDGLAVWENGQGVLEDCDIFGNFMVGVGIERGGNPTIRRSQIHDNELEGLHVCENGQGVLEDCDIFGNEEAGVGIGEGGNPTLRRCKLHDGKGDGLYVSENGRGVLEDCDIFANALAGAQIKQGGNPTIRGCKLHDNEENGLFVYENGQGVLEDCDIFANALAGVLISEGGNPILRRCKLHDGKNAGLHVAENGRGVLEDCDIFGNAGPGVAILRGGNPTIRRCKLHDSQHLGLFVDSNGQGVLENCDIFGNALPGVAISEGGNPIIRRSQIHDGKHYGIHVQNKGRGTIEGCTVVRNAKGDWSIDASSQLRRL